LNEWAARNLLGAIPEKNRYREIVSGETIEDRPQVQEVLRLIESPKYKAILVVEVQRLSRGDLEDAGRLIKLLRYTNTVVITPQKTYDLHDEYDRDIFERELKRGNEFLEYQKRIMKRGREASVKKGNFIGSIAPYGYDKTFVMDGKEKCHTLKPNPKEAPIVKMIFDMYVNQNLGRVTIARNLNDLGIRTKKGNLWSQDAIKSVLENEHYIGKIRWNRRKGQNIVEDGEIRQIRPKSKLGEYLVYDGRHESIISDELFQAAREKQGKHHRAKPSTKVRNPLAGLLYCQCGRTMSLRTYKKNGQERSAPRLICDNQSYCGTSSALYSEILDRVRVVLQDCINDFEVKIRNDDKTAAKIHSNLIKQLKNKLEELDKKELAQWEAQADPDPDKRMPHHVFKALNEKLLKEKEEVQQALTNATASIPEPIDYEEKMKNFKEALYALDHSKIPAEQKNLLLKNCIERIDYRRDKSERLHGYKRNKAMPCLKVGGNWSSPPVDLNFKLKI
ncbi:MAG: recombinase family protein, partial [Lachnospiraceae bacterium]